MKKSCNNKEHIVENSYDAHYVRYMRSQLNYDLESINEKLSYCEIYFYQTSRFITYGFYKPISTMTKFR